MKKRKLNYQWIFTGFLMVLAALFVIQQAKAFNGDRAVNIPGFQQSISGHITNNKGEALSGVSIFIKGTSKGTITNEKGDFEINAKQNDILVISYIGYVGKEVIVGKQVDINITLLQIDNVTLNDVVVIGYGTQKKGNLTGAVSIVGAEDIANRPIIDAGEALQGKAAGVQVTSNSGKPGAGLSIRIRGSSSISAGNDPLYIVDGIPMTDISSYNPGDIESISILKDAASAAIYGTRAANGVVVITTKKGLSGKSKIQFSTYYGTTSPTKMLSVLNAKQYQDYVNELKGPNTISDSAVAATDINWPDRVFQNGNQVNYQLSISGGSEKTQHYISLDYTNQVGMIKPATFDRLNGRVNLTSKATDWLTVNTSTVISRTHTNGVTDNASVARGGVVLSALETPSIVPEYNTDGTIAANQFGNGWENPLGSIIGSYNKSLTDHLLGSASVQIKFYKDLMFESKFGIDYSDRTDTYFLDPFLTTYGRNTRGQQSQTVTNNLTWLSEQTLNYTHNWERNHLTALAGWTAQNSRTQANTINGSVLFPQYRLLPWAQAYLRDSIKSSNTSIDEWALVSYLGRVTYDFDSKYLFQANIRSDNSSRFAKGNRTATFPSFSAGWRISREDFMRNVSLINDLKLRIGWGQNGNQEGLSSYGYLPLSNINSITGISSPVSIAPQSLTWETSTQSNIGIDASLLNNRLSFTGDFYVKKTKNVLYNVQLPSQAGFSVAPVNGASMQNIGEEFLISSKNIFKKDFNWSTDLTLSFNQNKVTALINDIQFVPGYGGVDSRGNAIALATGYGLGEFYGYVAKGVDPNTGHELYLTRKDSLTDTPLPSDRRLIGNAQPKFIYGLTNNLSYKNFSLTIFLEGSQGSKIFNAGRLESEAMMFGINQSSAILNRWKKPGDITNIPGVGIIAAGSNYDPTNNSLISTRFLESGSYLRFKTVTLMYNINPNLLSRIGLSAASVYVSANNLFTITKYKGFDPEVNSNGNNNTENQNIAIGMDNGAYPQAKMFMFGLNVTLK